MEILLNSKTSKKSSNINNSLTVNLHNGRRALPIDDLRTTVNEVELYDNERKSSTSIRLTCTINTICSNVLFNPITEIVKYEGSDSALCLNFVDSISNEIDNDNLTHKLNTSFSSMIECIRDTQLSNNSNNFEYHCGVDIFNNHILRSNSFKAVCPIRDNGKSDTFNTIADMARALDGQPIKGFRDVDVESSSKDIDLHLYLNEDILSFNDCISERLSEDNGWFGFNNRAMFETITSNTINRVINNRKACDFIDLYPSRDLFSFVPKYNKYRKRIEKNWNYCLTYPYSSYTSNDMPFLYTRNSLNSLKIYSFDFEYKSMNGISSIKLTSICKHGLSKGNKINLYNNTTLLLTNTDVLDVIDDYTFLIYKNGFENKNYNNLSFKRVVDGEEVKYYVRLFTKLPNWKFSEVKPTEYEMYKDGSTLISDNQIEFDSHIGKLAFSKNIYNDDISEIVFTDDIDIYGLKDNLGRPLTSIYLTVLKNNAGYKEWYNEHNTTAETIEYSHCFGELSCGFEYDKDEQSKKGDIKRINNIDNGDKYKPLETIEQDKKTFYGDLCCYSDATLDEMVIQPICFRFNTAQRELIKDENKIEYDEINNDDYDYRSDFEIKKYEISDIDLREGYYYYPHFEIPIKTISVDISEQKPIFLTVKGKISTNNQNISDIFTIEKHNLTINEPIILVYKGSDNKNNYINGVVTNIVNVRKIQVKFDATIPSNDYKFKLIKKDESIPSYAQLSKNDTCMYRWREIIENGYDNESDIEQYPFTNGSLYINKGFNLYLRRQDPHNYGGIKSKNSFDVESNIIKDVNKDNYYNEEEITC